MRLSKKTERCFRTILLIITTCACICIAIFIFLQFTERKISEKAESSKRNVMQPEKLTDEKCIPVCDSRSCISQANILLRSINPTTDPCENFQKFLCGTYEEAAGRYEDKDMMTDMTLIMLNKLKSIIENIKGDPGSAAGKMKIVYDSCVNLGSSEVRSIDNFRQILSDVEIFNWPYLAPDFHFSDNGLHKLLATYTAFDIVRWFRIMPMNEEDMKESENVMMMQYTAEFTNSPAIPRDTAVAILRYFSMESEDIEIILNDHDDVRSDLISIYKELEKDFYRCLESSPNCTLIRINCSSAENNEWEHVCGFYQIYLNVTNLKQYVSRNEVIILDFSVRAFRDLFPCLKAFSDRSVANFFAMEFFWNHLDEVNFFFRREKQKYSSYFLSEKKTNMPSSSKWEYCVTWITENMKIVLENELVKSYLTNNYVNEIHDIHETITSAVIEMINRQQWILKHDKNLMGTIIEYIGCNMILLKKLLLPDNWYVNQYLKMFKPTRTNFLQNSLYYRKALKNAHTVLKIRHDIMTQPNFEANAESDRDNWIILHYGLLMPPVYFPGHEKFINHILMAPIFGHEIGHSILHYLRSPIDGSSISSERKSCIENQFSKFKFTHLDENLNGTRYIEESLSDNLGFAVADKMIDDLEDDFVLPGLTYTSKQLLYMNTRQLFCSKSTEKMEIDLKTKYSHAPPEYRIIASGQNSKGYSEAFSCPLGSYMNPEEKCSLFDSV